MTKFIVVVGGVISGVGKGISTASIGKILQNYGYSVTAVKIDPYLNYDAGTLRPTEHGEVWVTEDGGEIDQDLGNYERFLGKDIMKKNNITTGQVYSAVIEKERAGGFLGKTVQVIPHIPMEVIRRVKECGEGHDVCLIEIGGTIGDYENVPYLFAMKRLERELGKKNVCYVLVTYLIVPRHMNEMKTKPTQQAIKMLSEAAGIFPDFILCRGHVGLDEVRKKKIEMYANIDSKYIISEPDIDSVYRVPLDLEKENVGLKVLEKLGLMPRRLPDWTKWERLVNAIVNPERIVKVAIVGKYVGIGSFTLEDSYVSVKEALIHASANLGCGVEVVWVDSNNIDYSILRECDGVIVPGGFGSSGIDGKIEAIKYCRTENVPYLGLCYGMQLALIEFSRNVCSITDANTAEIEKTNNNIIDIMPSQKEILEKKNYGGTMRLGGYCASLVNGSIVHSLYSGLGRVERDSLKVKNLDLDKKGLCTGDVIIERHRHRYEVNPKYIELLESAGMKFSGFHMRSDGTKLVEFIELPSCKYFVATQAHPEFKSRLDDPAPLFYGFVRACLD